MPQPPHASPLRDSARRTLRLEQQAIGALIAGTIYRSKTGSLRAAVEVEKAKSQIKVLRARREELLRQDVKDDAAVTAIDIDLDENRRTIETVREAADVPSEDLAAELERLGF
jgi:hypothetical protein